MKMYHPPAAADFGDSECLDVRSALKNFLGKSQAEAFELFAGNGNFAEDLGWMDPVAFEFYLEPAVRYVESRHSTGDIEFVSFLLTAVLGHTSEHRLSGSSRTIVKRLISHIEHNPHKFVSAADASIDWGIEEDLRDLRRIVEQ